MNELKLVRISQKTFFKKLEKRERPWFVSVLGTKMKVLPEVFPPRTDTRLLVKHLVASLNIGKGSKVLDLGTGSGAIAVMAGLKGASGTALDINPKAVINANENFKNYHLGMRAILSDGLANLSKEKFDFIFATGPYLDEKIDAPIKHAIYGMKRFMGSLFREGPKYLKAKGEIWATFPEWGDICYFENLLKRNKLNFIILGKKITGDHQRVYRLYRIVAV